MSGLLSKNISLKMGSGSSASTLADLQDIPDLGGDVDTVEVTTLADGSRKYINGLKDFGDLEFTFLYDNSSSTSSYRVLKTAEAGGAVQAFELTFPDGTKFGFSGQVSVKINSAGVGDALTFTLKIALSTDITVTDPTSSNS